MKVFIVLDTWDDGGCPEDRNENTNVSKVFSSKEKAVAYIDGLTFDDFPEAEYSFRKEADCIHGIENGRTVSFVFKNKFGRCEESNHSFRIEECELE